jgi:hypothetical protein
MEITHMPGAASLVGGGVVLSVNYAWILYSSWKYDVTW